MNRILVVIVLMALMLLCGCSEGTTSSSGESDWTFGYRYDVTRGKFGLGYGTGGINYFGFGD